MRMTTEPNSEEKAAEGGEPASEDEPSPARRALMSKVRTAGTGPELAVRSLLHRAGYRYALNRRDLPGKPDIVMPKHRLAIFVHGCFWHRHAGCRRASLPKVRREFWEAKLLGNVARDASAVARLERLGWTVVTVWGCEAAKAPALVARLAEHLDHGALERAQESGGEATGRPAGRSRAAPRPPGPSAARPGDRQAPTGSRPRNTSKRQRPR